MSDLPSILMTAALAGSALFFGIGAVRDLRIEWRWYRSQGGSR